MAEENDFEDEAGSTATDQDNAVLRALRQEIKTLKAELADAKKATTKAVDEAKAQWQRGQEVSKIVNGLGYPKLADLVSREIEGDVTEESVKSFLEGLGLEAKSQSDGQEVEDAAQSVAGVASLGNAVAAAARGTANKSVEDRLKEAKSTEEITAIMAEAGLLAPS